MAKKWLLRLLALSLALVMLLCAAFSSLYVSHGGHVLPPTFCHYRKDALHSSIAFTSFCSVSSSITFVAAMLPGISGYLVSI